MFRFFMIIISVFVVLAAGTILVAAKVEETPKQCEEDFASDVEAVVAGNNEFAFELYAKLKDVPEIKKGRSNLFFSPYSISTALAMTWAGARGETERQMAEVLGFTLPQGRLHKAFGVLEKRLNSPDEERSYQLNVANALWGQKDYEFLEDFVELTKNSYGAGLRIVDFVEQTEEARKTINGWVEKKTEDKIKDLIGPGVLDVLTRLVLTNAIYFKGDWAIQFDKKGTRDAAFMVSADEKVDVPMMELKAKFKYAEKDGLQIIELPYKGDELSMVVLLPREIGDFDKLEGMLTQGKLDEWFAVMREREVRVYLPKFKMTWGAFNLKGVLRAMGMKDCFSLPPADFSGMTGIKDLFISHILHKAFVAVDEEGTEAAAATAVVMKRTSVMIETVFRADHPFVFMIKDNRSGSILFMGRLMRP